MFQTHALRGLDRLGARLIARFVLVAAAALLLVPALAHADSSSTLTIVGTSDVSDSGLMANVIQPAFQKAYPQFQFKYIGGATGTAISEAESGSAAASVLIVHAASLENQFVAGGYSYEKYGRALFTNDFVLAGPSGDPAGVAANGAHNVVQAFADVAAAGAAGKASFVSRGGTPGTTVEEHMIWGLVDSSHAAPAGLLLCAVSSTLGGGETPIAAGHGVTANGQPCPNGGALPSGSALPSWYKVNGGAPQGQNVQLADACNNVATGPNTCYVLTDRGTYDYLASGTDPAGTIKLVILTRDDDSSAPGGANLLVNYFHGYIINPSKPGEAVNLTAAQDFMNLVTSPAIQAQIGAYLAKTTDPGGAPFKPDASPIITINGKGFPAQYHAGRAITISGTLANAEPGWPVPARQPVSVEEVSGVTPLPIATVKSSATGAFRIRFVPPSTGQYVVGTPQITQIENASLTPPFGDILSPGATAAKNVTVHSALTTLHVRSIGGAAMIVGAVAPGTGHVRGVITVLARRGKRGKFRKVAVDRLAAGDGNFALAPRLAPGSWQLKVQFADPRAVIGASSKTLKITVAPRPATTVRVRSAKVSHGRVTVSGTVSGPSAGNVELIGLRTSGAAARFDRIGGAAVKGGKFTLHSLRLKPGVRWILQVEDVVTPTQISYSTPLRTINVK